MGDNDAAAGARGAAQVADDNQTDDNQTALLRVDGLDARVRVLASEPIDARHAAERGPVQETSMSKHFDDPVRRDEVSATVSDAGRDDDAAGRGQGDGAGPRLGRRHVLGAAAAVGGAAALSACSSSTRAQPAASASHGTAAVTGRSTASGGASASTTASLIGDGSMSDTGRQPHLPTPTKLKPGEEPPQFVVVSWDGAGELVQHPLFQRFRDVARDTGAFMTLFLSGLYLLPESKKHLYNPPRHPQGASDIGYLKDENVHATIKHVGAAWLEGHEIGTHFNGHFCGPNGVGRWTPTEWKSEIDQAMSFVANWKTNTGFTDLPALPFDYRKELIGGRTPCIEGGDNLRTAVSKLGWRYDTSKTTLQTWPKKDKGLWDLSLMSIPFPGHSFQVLSMDYNMMYNQSGGVNGSPSMRPTWRKQAVDAYLAGVERAYTTNRAPLVIGNHFERWNGGIYMDAVEQVMRKLAHQKDVRMVSFRHLVDWLDAQDPAVITKLQGLNVGEKPKGGWAEFLGA